jgi:hypothetical protein
MMGRFRPQWLALREPADARARSAALTRTIAARYERAATFRVLDLGAGTGANLRYLAPFLTAVDQIRDWLLVDQDATLLSRAPADVGPCDRVETREIDLASRVNSTLDALCVRRDLVTASALLDLVSEPWLATLARCCGESAAAVLFALSYNGDIRCVPDEPEDGTIRDLVNRHQRTDKGFGPALGPDAVGTAARLFAACGYEVRRQRSDWIVGGDQPALQQELIAGWAEAAEAIAPPFAPVVHDWKTRRLAHVAAGRSVLTVGHEDLAGQPLRRTASR